MLGGCVAHHLRQAAPRASCWPPATLALLELASPSASTCTSASSTATSSTCGTSSSSECQGGQRARHYGSTPSYTALADQGVVPAHILEELHRMGGWAAMLTVSMHA